MEFEILVGRGYMNFAPRIFTQVFCQTFIAMSNPAFAVLEKFLDTGTHIQKYFACEILRMNNDPVEVLLLAWGNYYKNIFRIVYPCVKARVEIRKYQLPRDTFHLFALNHPKYTSSNKYMSLEMLMGLVGDATLRKESDVQN